MAFSIKNLALSLHPQFKEGCILQGNGRWPTGGQQHFQIINYQLNANKDQITKKRQKR